MYCTLNHSSSSGVLLCSFYLLESIMINFTSLTGDHLVWRKSSTFNCLWNMIQASKCPLWGNYLRGCSKKCIFPSRRYCIMLHCSHTVILYGVCTCIQLVYVHVHRRIEFHHVITDLKACDIRLHAHFLIVTHIFLIWIRLLLT